MGALNKIVSQVSGRGRGGGAGGPAAGGRRPSPGMARRPRGGAAGGGRGKGTQDEAIGRGVRSVMKRFR